MSSFPRFISAVSVHKISLLNDQKQDVDISYQASDLGFSCFKLIQKLTSIFPLFDPILELLPLTVQEGQREIEVCFTKIIVIKDPILFYSEIYDSHSPTSLKCVQDITNAYKLLYEIQKFISILAIAAAPTVKDSLKLITKNIKEAQKLFNSALIKVLKMQNLLIQKTKPLQALPKQFLTQVSNMLYDLSLFETNLLFSKSYNKLIKDAEKYTNISDDCKIIIKFSQELFNIRNNDSILMTEKLNRLISEFPQISRHVGQIKDLLPVNQFMELSSSMINSRTSISKLLSNLELQTISNVIKYIASSYINNEPVIGLIQMMKTLLNSMKSAFVEGILNGIDRNVVASYNIIMDLLDKNLNDREETTLVLFLACRFAVLHFTDFSLRENLLISISEKIASITRIVHKDAINLIFELQNLIDSNVENFDIKLLSEMNFYFKVAKKFKSFETDSEDFIVRQQVIYDTISCVTTPLRKLISTTKNETIKTFLVENLKKIQKCQMNFSKWIHQYYGSIVGVIRCRAEDAANILSFSLEKVSEEVFNNFDLSNTFMKELTYILDKTPKVLTYDLLSTVKLIEIFSQIVDVTNEFMEGIKKDLRNPLYLFLHYSALALKSLCSPLPKQVMALTSLVNFGDKESFICGILSSSSAVFDLTSKLTEKNSFDYEPLYDISYAFTFAFTCDALIDSNKKDQENLSQLSKTLKSTFEVIWRLCIAHVMKEEENMLDFKTCIKSVNNYSLELYTAIANLKQPTIKYNLPKNVEYFAKFNQQIESLKSENLKTYSQIVMKYFRMSKESTNLLNCYFDLIKKSLTNDFSKSIENFLKVIKKSYETNNFEVNYFIQSLSYLSLSLAMQSEQTTNYSLLFKKSFNDLLNESINFLNQPNDLSKLLKIAYLATRFIAINEMITQINILLREFLFNCNKIRQSSKSNIDYVIKTLESLNKLEIYQETIGNTNIDLEKTKEIILSGTFKKNEIDEIIKQFCYQIKLVDNIIYHRIGTVINTDYLVNLCYDRFEIFSQEMYKNEPNISTLFLCVADVFILTVHSLSNNELIETPLSSKLVINFLTLLQDLINFNKNRILKMIDSFDQMIYLVENPGYIESSAPSNFKLLQFGYFNIIIRLCAIFAYFIELSTWSVVPEMADEYQNDFTNLMTSYLSVCETATSYFAESNPNIQKVFDAFSKSCNSIIKESRNINIGETDNPMLKIISTIKSFAANLVELLNSVINAKQKTIIKASKKEIEQIPNDLILPQIPKIGSLPISALNEMKMMSTHYNDVLSKITDSFNQDDIKTILSLLKEFKELSDNFGNVSISLIPTISDFSLRLIFMTALYNWCSNLNGLLFVARSRFAGKLVDDDEINRIFAQLSSQKEKVISLTQDASKIEIIKSSEDTVSSSLTECAKEVGMTLSKITEIEDKKKNSTMDDFESVLLCASRIVERSRQLTIELIQKNGKIDNEKGMIHAASEVVEAVKLLFAVLEIGKTDKDIEYKIIAAAKIINSSIASLVASVNVKGGDSEKIINEEISKLRKFTDKIIKDVEVQVNAKLEADYKAKHKKKQTPVIMRLNLQNEINEKWKRLEASEKSLYEFRKKK